MKKSKLWMLPAIAIAALLAAYLPVHLRAQQPPEAPAPPERRPRLIRRKRT